MVVVFEASQENQTKEARARSRLRESVETQRQESQTQDAPSQELPGDEGKTQETDSLFDQGMDELTADSPNLGSPPPDSPDEITPINSISKKLGTIRTAMEINLTKIWRILTWPLRGSWHGLMRLLGQRGRSRRDRPSESQQRLKKIKMLRLLAFLALALVVLGVLAFFGLFLWHSRDLPKPGQVVRREGFTTQFLDREGRVIFDMYQDERREPVRFDDLPETLIQATIAVEDKDFYRHQGFDLLTIARIPYNYLVRNRVVGGSTLTQQLVKNVLLSNERTVNRKFKELVLALQIERTFTKDEILEMYLNEAPYGGTAWGVGAASTIYFSKPVSELTLVESAILAGLPQRPTAYSPFSGRTNQEGELLWRIRTMGVLRRMLEDGYITQLEHEEAIAELNQIEFERQLSNLKAPHFVFYVRDQLEQMFGEDLVERGGLRVTTTLDLDLHEEAQMIVAEEIEKVENLNISNGAVVVMDPRTGEVLSMVGSRDYNNSEIGGQFNVAADGLRQPGSSIKPITYLSLLEQGYTPASMLVDAQTNFVTGPSDKPYEPRNYDGIFRGPVLVRNSLGSSLNIPAVKALALVGVEQFLTQAYSMGLYTLEPTSQNMSRFGLAVTLGGAEVHLIDLTTAYSSFANGGLRVEPISVLNVQTTDGKTLFEHRHVEGPRVMSEAGAFLINDILSDNSARLLAFGANSLLNINPSVAVKTGTTNDQRDNWAVGWSQEILVGSWVGNNDNSPMTRVASGITGASPIWRRIMLAAIERGYGTPAFEVPEGVEQVEVNAISGYPAHSDFPSRMDFAVRGTLPALPDPIHTKLKLCRGEDKLANEARIAAGDYDEREFIVLREDDPVSRDGENRWQIGINQWIESQEDGRYRFPTEYCGESSDVSVNLRRPRHERSYEETEIEIEVDAGSGDGIDRIEIFVNGSLRETINSRSHRGKLNLPAGRYEIWAVAYSRGGKSKESRKVRIGTGGQDWREATPTPTPSPTPTPTPTPTPSPTATPLPTPTLPPVLDPDEDND